MDRGKKQVPPCLSASGHTASCPCSTLHVGKKGLSSWQGRDELAPGMESWCGRWEAWTPVPSLEPTWAHHHFTSHLQNGNSQPLSGPQPPLLSNEGNGEPGWS